MIFPWSLSDSRSSPVSRARLRLLAVLSNAAIWIVSTRPPTSKPTRSFNLCFACRSLIVVVCCVVVYVPEKRAANIRRMTIGSPMLAIRRAPADHDTHACCLGPTLCNIVIGHFYHAWYIVAIPEPGVVYDLRTWHWCDQEQLWWLYMKSGSQKNPLLSR